MTLVVDASVAAKWLIEEDDSELARRLLVAGERLVAPDILLAEIANVAWRKHRTGQATAEQAHAMPQSLRLAPVELVPTPALVDRALAIAFGLDHPIYDCIYIACAETHGARLVTADVRLLRALKDKRLGRLVSPLSP
jgi:predicted nucleic acid-binding protein